ncbi:MAG: PhzF family phenazine biosynthesis protein [Oxalobacter formigenes]|nr:PhzF family phenazine biosynthesis protein [Oxalobacter formigenes]
MENWLPGRLTQNIAQENNLSETAFTVKNGKHYELRWFTPGVKIELCGHAPWEPPVCCGTLRK